MLGILSLGLLYHQIFQESEYHQSAKQFGFRSGWTKTFCKGDQQKAIAD